MQVLYVLDILCPLQAWHLYCLSEYYQAQLCKTIDVKPWGTCKTSSKNCWNSCAWSIFDAVRGSWHAFEALIFAYRTLTILINKHSERFIPYLKNLWNFHLNIFNYKFINITIFVNSIETCFPVTRVSSFQPRSALNPYHCGLPEQITRMILFRKN